MSVVSPVVRRLRLLREHERLLMITVSTVMVMAGQGVIAPVLPLFARSFGVGAAVIGLTLSFFAVARMLLNVPLGILSDRRGRRMLLVGGPLVTAVGMIGSGFAPSIVVLLLWRLVAGAGSAMYMTGAQVYLVDISTPANRARFIGTNQAALLLGTAVGPALGGFLAEGFGLRAPFYVVGAFALLTAAYAFLRLPETFDLADDSAAGTPHGAAGTGGDGAAPGGAGAVPRRRPWVEFATSRNFLAVALVTMSIFFTRTASRFTLMPLLAVDRLEFSPGGLGLLFTAMAFVNLVGVGPAAWVADHFGRKRAIIPSGAVVAVALALLAASDTQVLFVAAAIFLAVGTSIAGPAPAAYAADIAPAGLRGLAMGMYRTSGDVGFVIGPPLLGALADATSIGWGLVANALLVVVAIATFGVVAVETVTRRRPPVTADEAGPRSVEEPPTRL